MLGLIHITLEEFIKAELGPETWDQVLAKAGLSATSLPLSFETHCHYTDALFYSTLDAASKVTGLDVATILQRYGRHFLLQAREQGYEKLLLNFSSSFSGFLANLNNLHLHLSLGVPSMMTPDFRVKQMTSNSLELHYCSMREGLGPLVEGMVQGLADIYYNGLAVSIERIGSHSDKTCNHQVWRVIFPEDQDYVDRLEAADKAAENSIYAMDAPTFYRLQPFHFVLDRQCKVLQVGSVLQRVLPEMKKGSKAADHLRVAKPYACQGDKGWDFDEIVSCEKLCFILKGRSKVLELKGQFIRTRLPPSTSPPSTPFPTQPHAHTSQPTPGPPSGHSCHSCCAPSSDTHNTHTTTSTWLPQQSSPPPTSPPHAHPVSQSAAEPWPQQQQQQQQQQQRGVPSVSGMCVQASSASAAAPMERRRSSLWGNFSIGDKSGSVGGVSGGGGAARRSMAWNRSEGSNLECVGRETRDSHKGGKGEGDGGARERGASNSGSGVGGSGGYKPKKDGFAALKAGAFLQKLGLGSSKSAKPSTRAPPTTDTTTPPPPHTDQPLYARSHPTHPPSTPHNNATAATMLNPTAATTQHRGSESSSHSTSNNPSVHKSGCGASVGGGGGSAAGAGACPMASLRSTHLGTFSAHQHQQKASNQAAHTHSRKSAPVGFLEPPMILQQQALQQQQQQLLLRQQSMEGQEVLLFLGSPRMLNLDEMRSFGMTLEDVPLYDMSSEFVVMAERLERDKRTRLMLLDERAVLEARAEMLAQQNAAQEAAYIRMGEALEEALQQRDESYGVPQPEGGSCGFQVETPAEKALDLLDKIMHGINPDMREVLEVRDAILLAGVDLRAPMRLQDQVATELNRSNLDDEEVQAALTQLLAVDGGKKAGTHSRWSLSDSSENEESSDSDTETDMRRNSSHNSLKGLKRAVSGTLDRVKAPFTSGVTCTQDRKQAKPRPRKALTQITPKTRPTRGPSIHPLRSKGSVPDTLAEEETRLSGNAQDETRRSSSFSAGVDSGTGPECTDRSQEPPPPTYEGPSDAVLSKQLRCRAGRRDLSQRLFELLTPAPTLTQPTSPRGSPRVHSPPPIIQGGPDSRPLSPKHSDNNEQGPAKAGTQSLASGDTERAKFALRGLGKCKSTTTSSTELAQASGVHTSSATGANATPSSAPDASTAVGARAQGDASAKLGKSMLKGPLRSLTGPLQLSLHEEAEEQPTTARAVHAMHAVRAAPAVTASSARTDSATLPALRAEPGAAPSACEELATKHSARTDSALPVMAAQEHTRARIERRSSLLAFYRDNGEFPQCGLAQARSGASEVGFGSQRSSGGTYVPGALDLGTIQSNHMSLMTHQGSMLRTAVLGPDANSEPLPCIQYSADSAQHAIEDNRKSRRLTRKARRRQSLLMALKPPEGVAQLLSPPSDPVLEVLAKVDDWHFDTFELNEVTNGRPLSTLAFALLSRSNLMAHFKISEVRLARFLVAVEDGYYDNPYHNRIHAADVLRTLHVIMTRGGVRQAMHTAHDIALLAAYIAAVVHDFEHKGVNNDFLVKTMDRLALIYNDRSPMENHHAAAAFQLLLQDEQCAALSSTNHKVREALRKIVVDSVLATDMKSHFTFASHFNTKIPALLGFVRPLLPRQSNEAARKSLSLRRESLHLPPGHQLGPSSTNSLDMGHTAPANAVSAAHRASSLGHSGSAQQVSSGSSGPYAASAPMRSFFSRQPTAPVGGASALSPHVTGSLFSHFRGEAGTQQSGTEAQPHAHAHARVRECSAGSPLQHASLAQHAQAQQPCVHSTHSTHGTHSSSAFVSACEAGVGGSGVTPAVGVLSGSAAASARMNINTHTSSSSSSSHALDSRDSPRAVQQLQQQQQRGELSEPLPRVDSGSQPSATQIQAPSATSSGQLPLTRASISLARPSVKPGVSAAGRPSLDPLSLSRHAQHPRQLVIVDEEMRTLVLQMALKCADIGHLAHKRDVHRRWVMVLEEEMFRQGDREKAAGLPVSPLMDRMKGGISKSQAGFFSIVALPQLESFCKVFPACRPMLEQAQDNYKMWLEESKTGTSATTVNLSSK